MHMAAACIKAGNKWQAALARLLLRENRKYKPSELGLSLWVPEVNRAENRIESYWHLVRPENPPSRFERDSVRPTYGDKVAFWCDLWENGRGGSIQKSTLGSYLIPASEKRYRCTGVRLAYRILERSRTLERQREETWCYSRNFNRVDVSEWNWAYEPGEDGGFLVRTTRW